MLTIEPYEHNPEMLHEIATQCNINTFTNPQIYSFVDGESCYPGTGFMLLQDGNTLYVINVFCHSLGVSYELRAQSDMALWDKEP